MPIICGLARELLVSRSVNPYTYAMRFFVKHGVSLVTSLLLITALLIAAPFEWPGDPLPPPSTAIPTVSLETSIRLPSPEVAYPTPMVAAARATAIPVMIPVPSSTPAAPDIMPSTAIRVGLQVGHWKSNELPSELARLRSSTGAYAAGVREVDINLDVANRTAVLLRSLGMTVDILPATVPPNYRADVFVALHVDGVSREAARGYKLATPFRTSPASQQLADALFQAYGVATGLPQSDSITVNMKGYYAFMYRLFAHAIDRTTPAVILELGYLTNPDDRTLLLQQPDRVAVGVANGIVAYLNQRNPADQQALIPIEYPVVRANSSQGVVIRRAPQSSASQVFVADQSYRLVPIAERDGWYEVVVARDWRVSGWVLKESVTPTGDPLPEPPSADR